MSETESVAAGRIESPQPLGDRVVNGAALMWATSMALRLLQLFTTMLLARLLSPDDYGVVALAMTAVGLITVVSDLQISGAIVRSQDLSREHFDTAFTISVLRSALIALIMVAAARPTASSMHEPRIEAVFYALAFGIFATGFANPHFLLFTRDLKFWPNAVRRTGAAIAASLLGIALAFWTHSYWALVVSTVAGNIVTTALSYWRVPGLPGIGLSKSREMLAFGTWMIGINVLNYINNRTDYFIIGRNLGSANLGAYHVGQQFTTMATGDIIAPISTTLLPAFSKLLSDPARLRNAYKQVQVTTLALALPAGFGVSIMAPEFVHLLAGKKWDMAIPVMSYLSPLIALQTTFAGVESLAIALNKGRLLFIRSVIFFFVRVSAMFAGFYLGGFMGIIYARVLTGTFFMVYGLALAARLTQSRVLDPLTASWRSIVSVAVMWLVLRAWPAVDVRTLQETGLLLLVVAKVTVGGAAYLSVHLLLWKMAGCPAGAEQKILSSAGKVVSRVIPWLPRLGRA